MAVGRREWQVYDVDDDMLAVLHHVAVAVRAEPVVLLICPGRSCQLANVAIPLTHHPLLNARQQRQPTICP